MSSLKEKNTSLTSFEQARTGGERKNAGETSPRRLSGGKPGLEEIRPVKPLPGSGQDAEAAALSRSFVIGLLFASVLLFGVLLLLLWSLSYFGAKFLSSEAGLLTLGAVMGVFMAALALSGALAWALATNRRLPFIHNLRGLMNFVFFPLMRLAGIFFRIPKSKVRLAFIRLNNDLAGASRIRCKPHELLILLPHCIQKSACPHRLTHNIQACTRCGACKVGPLLKLAERYGVEVVIVPGGTVARQMVKEKRPKCLIAVACHRDLTSGIRDVAALPVFGVVNERPFGPCINTSVDVDEIERAIRMFTGAGAAGN
ncbi:MAG: DUF116 domain-containing protein [Desulfovibrionaceae bacterium]|nr:DUF116 domain-containing protein [Desulfovibrionaceae bacterium]